MLDSARNGNGRTNDIPLDVKLDRFLKVATVVRWFIVPIIVACAVLVYEGHNELDEINQKVKSTYDMMIMHDQFRRERDRIRLQAHHQVDVGFKDSCTKCKLVDQIPTVDIPKSNGFYGK